MTVTTKDDKIRSPVITMNFLILWT